MRVKEWLEKEGFLETVPNLDCETNNGFGYPVSLLMERYANYKTKELQANIFGFRQLLNKVDFTPGGDIVMCTDNLGPCLSIEDFYDFYFNIEKTRNEKNI